MCGISGILLLNGSNALAETDLRKQIRRMGLFLFHRGPDAWGEYVSEGIAIGHNRLAIIDIAGGLQPMTTADGRFHITFNGEIYNYKSIWSDLQSLGCKFQSHHSDTEVIVNGFAQWGPAIFERLEGMFAIAIWDSLEKQLYLSRDRMGIKPLYYSEKYAGFVFASEPKAILATDIFGAPRMRQESLAEYFLFRAPVYGTMFQGIQTLDPGTWMRVSGTGVTETKTYWTSWHYTKKVNQSVVEEQIAKAVKSHAVSDVPLGVFLSGGVDSSYIAALLKNHIPLKAFTLGVHGELDESPIAKKVADHIGIAICIRKIEESDIVGQLQRWCYFNDDPVSDPSALALMLLAEHARKAGMKVMVAGEGADELFGGYNSYLRFAAMRKLAWAGLSPIAHLCLQGKEGDYTCWGKDVPFLGTAHIASRKLRETVLESHLRPSLAQLDQTIGSWWDGSKELFASRTLRRAMYFDQRVRLPNDLLPRTDRATMAWSLEARVPYLDRQVVETANGLKDSDCVTLVPRATKKLLKRAVRAAVPIEAIDRPKRGFDLPVAEWLRGKLCSVAKDALLDRAIDGLDYDNLEGLFDEHTAGRNEATALLWAWLILENWYRRWLSGQLYPLPPLLSEYNRQDYKILASSWPHNG